MLTDMTDRKQATWEFMERRLDGILATGKGIADLKVVGEAVGNGVLSLLNVFKTPPKYEHPMPKHESVQQDI